MTIAYVLFPGPFSMFNNTASTLGNHSLNPIGAILFRLSNIIGGALLFPLFLGLYEWKRDDKWSKISLNLTIILGCLMGFAYIMVGIFSQEYSPYHLMWAEVLFMLSFFSTITGGLFLLKHPDSVKPVVIFNFVTAALHFTLIFYLTHDVIIVEWIVIFATSINIILLVYNYKQMSQITV